MKSRHKHLLSGWSTSDQVEKRAIEDKVELNLI